MADFDYSGLVTANEKLTGLADQVRNVTGETSTLSIEGMTEALAALNLINYGTVKAGSTSIPATTQGDTLSLVAGTGITLTGNATNKSITIASSSSKNFSVSYTTIAKSTITQRIQATDFDAVSGGTYSLVSSFDSNTNYKGFAKSIGSLSSLKNKILKFRVIGSSYTNYTTYTLIIGASKILYAEIDYSAEPTQLAHTENHKAIISDVTSIVSAAGNSSAIPSSGCTAAIAIINSNLYFAWFTGGRTNHVSSSVTSPEYSGSPVTGWEVSYFTINF